MPDPFWWQAPPICLQHSFSSADSRAPGTVQAINGPPNRSTVRIDAKMEQRFIRLIWYLRFWRTKKVSSHFCLLQSLGQYPKSFFSWCQTTFIGRRMRWVPVKTDVERRSPCRYSDATNSTQDRYVCTSSQRLRRAVREQRSAFQGGNWSQFVTFLNTEHHEARKSNRSWELAEIQRQRRVWPRQLPHRYFVWSCTHDCFCRPGGRRKRPV